MQNMAAERLGRLRAEIDFADIEDCVTAGLHEFVDDFQSRLNRVGEAIFETFFAPRRVHSTCPPGGNDVLFGDESGRRVGGIADTRVTTGVELHGKRQIFSTSTWPPFDVSHDLRIALEFETRPSPISMKPVSESDRVSTNCSRRSTCFAAQIRRVADEDKNALYWMRGLIFNLHALVGGQLENELTYQLCLIFPQGNWVGG